MSRPTGLPNIAIHHTGRLYYFAETRYGDVVVQSTIAAERRVHRQKLAEAKRKKKEAAAAAEETAEPPSAPRSDRQKSTLDVTDVNVVLADDVSDNELSQNESELEARTRMAGDVTMADGD